MTGEKEDKRPFWEIITRTATRELTRPYNFVAASYNSKEPKEDGKYPNYLKLKYNNS